MILSVIQKSFAMPATLQISINFPVSLYPLHKYRALNRTLNLCNFKFSSIPLHYCSRSATPPESLRVKLPFTGFGRGGDGIFATRQRRVVLVKFNNGFGGGGGGKINSETARVLGNLALAILLTYLSMTGQLGWLLDAIVSIWILVVLLPVVGIGAFLWWAGHDILQGSCPNCGNEFQVFKSTLNDERQLCPFCSQPFSVKDDEFVRNPVKFSNQSSPFNQAFGNFSPRKKKGLLLVAAILQEHAYDINSRKMYCHA